MVLELDKRAFREARSPGYKKGLIDILFSPFFPLALLFIELPF